MDSHGDTRGVERRDRALVDLVNAALVDPNIHTDLRMRLERDLGTLLRSTHDAQYGAAAPERHEQALADHGGDVPSLLTAVLVDPNLHADLRMRIYREIPEMLHAARPAAGDTGAHARPS